MEYGALYQRPLLNPHVSQNLNIPRGYQSQATTSNGNLFTIGASWSGGQGGKNGELYDPTANTWTELAGCPVAPMLTADAQGMSSYPVSGPAKVDAHTLMLTSNL